MKVFWSWQSDTPGKTGRHFIRAALDAAIAELKQAPEVEEPAEGEAREALHIDQDRQGVRGSPELANTILRKIAASAVVVADVTPVSMIPASADGKRPEKRNMNPNVAIELGYALHALTHAGVLLVLNTQYGGREFLPFDLAHLSGPILFDLPEGADSGRRAQELKKLAGLFVTAFRPYLDQVAKVAAPTFVPVAQTVSAAAFWKPNETLARLGRDSNQVSYSYPDGNGFYLRVIPTSARPRPIPGAKLLSIVQEAQLVGMWRRPTTWHRGNVHGAICFEPDGPQEGNLRASTQVFPSGELWGNAPWLLQRHRTYGEVISGQVLEACYRQLLPHYVRFLQQQLGMEPPFNIIAGAVGVQSFKLGVYGTGWPEDDLFGPIQDNEIRFEQVLNDASDVAINTCLLAFFDRVFEHTGHLRPKDFGGFPLPVGRE